MGKKWRVFDKAIGSLGVQGVVSLGNFLVSIMLARTVSQAEFGSFAIFLSIAFMFQICCSSLLLYPFSVRRHAIDDADPETLLSSTFWSVLFLSTVHSVLFAAVLAIIGYQALLPSAVLAYFFWQSKEALRNFLQAEFRYGAAIRGEVLGYSSLVATIIALIYWQLLDLQIALYVMAASFSLATLVHFSHLSLVRVELSKIIATASPSIRLGKWHLLSEQVLFLRIYSVLWALTLLHGEAAGANYQAILNVVNVINPVIIGLASNIPQLVAAASSGSDRRSALAVAFKFGVVGCVPVSIFCIFVFLAPDLVLRALYGEGSSYLDLGLAVRVMVVAWFAYFVTELLTAVLLGLRQLKEALVSNVIALLFLLVLLPLIGPYGVLGACSAVLVSNLVRAPVILLLLDFGDRNYNPRKFVAMLNQKVFGRHRL